VPYKSPQDRNRVKNAWRYQRRLALRIIREQRIAAGVPVKGVLVQADVTPEELAAATVEAKARIKAGTASPDRKAQVRSKAMPKKPHPLPDDRLTMRLSDASHLPPDLADYGHGMVMVFLEELKVVGDMTICALKAGLPLHYLLRCYQEGVVEHREGVRSWNAAFYRACAQAQAHAMATPLLRLRQMIANADKSDPVDHRTRLRAIETYARLTFPERFGTRASNTSVSVFAGAVSAVSESYGDKDQGSAKVEDTLPGVHVIVPPTEDDLDAMTTISPGELEAVLGMLRRGELG